MTRLHFVAALLVLRLLPSLCVDIVAILPDRNSVFRNAVHNALLIAAKRHDVSIDIRDVGNYDSELTRQVFQDAIASTDQPKVYCIWPPNVEAKMWMRELHQVHKATIVQMLQVPGPEDWEYIAAATGSDALQQGENGAELVVEALTEKKISEGKVAVLAYPEDYEKGVIIYEAFERRLRNISSVEVVDVRFLPWGAQPAYDTVLEIADSLQRKEIHALFCMDDRILSGAYQALEDMGLRSGEDIMLIGSVCNGARELLERRVQYGTSLLSPYVEGHLAISAAVEYLDVEKFPEARHIHRAPVPIIKADSWETMFFEFEGESYLVDDLCTWTMQYKPVAGISTVDQVEDVCHFLDCLYIQRGLFALGYSLVGIVYLLTISSATLLFFYRNKTIVQLAQPFFLALVIFGSTIDTTSIIFMSRDGQRYSDDQLNVACIAWPWLLSIGHMTTTATLVAKMYRVKRVCVSNGNSRALRRIKITARGVSFFIICFLLFDLAILSIWFGIDPVRWKLHVASEDTSGYITQVYGSCTSSNSSSWVFPAILLLGHFSALVYANYLVYKTRRVHKISDSKNVVVALINSIELMAVGVPILILLNENVAASYMVRILLVFFNNVWVLSLVVMPKLFRCLRGQGDALPKNLLSSRALRGSTSYPNRFTSKELGIISSEFNIGSTETTEGTARTRTSVQTPNVDEERETTA